MTRDPDRLGVLISQGRSEEGAERGTSSTGSTDGDRGQIHIGEVLPPEMHGFPLTEDGVAQAFAIERADQLRFCHGPNKWYRWDGERWKLETTRLAFSWVRDLARRMSHYVIDDRTQQMLGRAAFASGVERFAQADRTFAVTPDLWDRDPFLMGTPGGVVDLRTGQIRAPTRSDYITKVTAVAPAGPSAQCPVWHQFLDQITCGDRELRRYIQQIFGYVLTGDVREESMFFLFGTGSNGKGTLLRTMGYVMGDYAMAADMATFTAGNYDRHPTELAKLAGGRLITATETERGRTWAWSRIKELTGNERPISARFMRKDFFEYAVTFKLMFAGNHKPHLTSTDEATVRRLNLLPFNYTARDDDRDNRLKDKLLAEGPAILRWAIDGCLDWQANGLVRPQCVIDATAQYLTEQDLFAQWVDAECVVGADVSDTHAGLYRSWSAFAAGNGETAGSGRDFAQRLQGAGFKPVKHTPGDNNKRGYIGIAVRRPGAAG
jgi:putative DNA primase/helicase